MELALILLSISLLLNIFLLVFRFKQKSNAKMVQANNEEDTFSPTSNIDIEEFISSFLKLINNLISSSEEAAISMNNIYSQSSLLNTSSKENIEDLANTQVQITDMLDKLSDNLELSKNISSSFEKANEGMIKRQDTIIDSINQYKTVNETVQMAKESIDVLVNSTKEVESIINTIRAISNQTNMLALNASIEAARAGEYGRGFSVVANEVKKLSAQTKEATDKISKVLETILNESINTQDGIFKTINILDTQSSALQETVGTIKEITSIFGKSKQYIEELTNKNDQSFATCQDVNEASSTVVGSIKNETQTINEIDNSVREQKNTISELTSSASNLKLMSRNLFELVKNDKNTVVAVTEEYPPFVIENDDIKKQGIDIDILREICRRNNLNLKLFFAPFDLSLELVKEGLVDMIPTISYTDDRNKYLNYTNGYRDEDKYIIFKNKNSNYSIGKYEDLFGRRIGIIDGYTYPAKFINDNRIIKDENHKLDTLFNKLFKNQVDGVLLNNYIGNYYINSNSLSNKVDISRFTLVAEEHFDARMALTRAKDTKGMVEILNKEFKNLIDDGTMKKIENKYLK